MSTTLENKYRNWVFTWNSDELHGLPPIEMLQKFLTEEFELFVFQLECGEETNRLHYQGCFRTVNRVRQGTLLSKFRTYFALTSITALTINRMCGEWDENYAYCTKSESRVGDSLPVSSPSLKRYSGRDIDFLIKGDNRYPWQKELVETIIDEHTLSVKAPDDRKIYWITDTLGNSGKSKLVKFLCFTYTGITKLAFGTASQLRSSVISAGPREVYLIDIPRTIGDDDSINSLISVLEDVKNGFVVSSMYGKHQTLLFEPPHVICFSNIPCPRPLMSNDRWIVKSIHHYTKEFAEENNGFT